MDESKRPETYEIKHCGTVNYLAYKSSQGDTLVKTLPEKSIHIGNISNTDTHVNIGQKRYLIIPMGNDWYDFIEDNDPIHLSIVGSVVGGMIGGILGIPGAIIGGAIGGHWFK